MITSRPIRTSENASGQYARSDRERTSIDGEQAVAIFLEKNKIVRDIFRFELANGLDYRPTFPVSAISTLHLTIDSRRHGLSAQIQQDCAAQKTPDEVIGAPQCKNPAL